MDDKLLRRIASEYVNQSGAELRRELDEITQSGVTGVTPSLDHRVFAKIRAIKRRRYSRIAGLVAACLALALIVPLTWLWREELYTAPPGDATSASPTAGYTSPTASGSAPAASPEYEIIPLTASLPERFGVAAVEQDIEKTVYYIEDAQLDDVVLTLQRAGDLTMFRELTPVMIGAYTAYGEVQPGYRLLAFERDGVLYILTCEHDINTLIELGESILI